MDALDYITIFNSFVKQEFYRVLCIGKRQYFYLHEHYDCTLRHRTYPLLLCLYEVETVLGYKEQRSTILSVEIPTLCLDHKKANESGRSARIASILLNSTTKIVESKFVQLTL